MGSVSLHRHYWPVMHNTAIFVAFVMCANRVSFDNVVVLIQNFSKIKRKNCCHVNNVHHCTLSLKFLSKFLARWKINTTLCCINHVYTLPPKLSFIIKKNRITFNFLHFHIRSKHFDRKGWQIWKIRKNYMKPSDSLCKDLTSCHLVLVFWLVKVSIK